MTTSDAIREARAAPEASARRPRPVRPFYWSLRRELWEHRAIYVAPLAVAAIVLFGFLLSLLHTPASIRIASLHHQLPPGGGGIVIACEFAGFALSVTLAVVGLFYCLGALHGERRDRSILFWKSLPVSDFTTVLAKACIPLIVLPVLAFAIALATQLIMLIVSTPVLMGRGIDAGSVWDKVLSVDRLAGMIYWFVAFTLWYAPLYGWCLLVSAWAKRATILWAVAPPVALAILETLALGSRQVIGLVHDRLFGVFAAAFTNTAAPKAKPDFHMDPARFLLSVDLWIGLGFAILFFAAAVWLRRRQEPI